MMVVILTPVDGIIRWLPRGFSCSPNLMHLGEAINFRVLDEESAVIPLVRIAAVHFNAETKS